MERELLIELGLEELPASWLPGLTQQLVVADGDDFGVTATIDLA